MEFSGLIKRYPNNRLLTEEDRVNQLKQKKRLNVEPHYQLSVIKLNSTYLESVDKWFGWKGVLSAVGLTIIIMFTTLYIGFIHVALGQDGKSARSDDVFILSATALMITPLVAAALWTLLKESFRYTHYPLRFNRKTGMVHVFRTDGTALSVRWDDVFFTLGRLGHSDEWEVRGHVLKEDEMTVDETFTLSYVGLLGASDGAAGSTQHSSGEFVRAHWEFVRRYMEDGPQAVSSQVQFCMPVDGRRESFRVGAERVFANFAGAPILVYWMMFPFCFAVSVSRFIAMCTSKIPQWPHDIEASCAVDQDDPFAIKGGPDGEREAVFPAAALSAGIHFCAAACASTAVQPKTTGARLKRNHRVDNLRK